MPAKLNTTIKKKPLNMNAEQQDAVRMQTNERLKQSSQSNKSFDTNRTQANAPVKATPAERLKTSQSDNILSVNNPVESDIPLIKRDPKTKTVTGVSLPNGETFDNISPEEVQKIVDNWNNESAAPANSMFEDVFRKQQTEKQQSETINAESTAQVANLSPSPQELINQQTQDPTLAEIQNNIADRELANKIEGAIGPVSLRKLSKPLTKTLNKWTGGAATPILQEMTAKVPAIGRYLDDYSNDGTFKAISGDMSRIFDDIKLSKDLASAPETSELAKEKFKKSIERLTLADAQLKYLYDHDSSIDKSEINELRKNIQAYFDGQIVDDKLTLRNNLNAARVAELQNG